VAGASPGCLAYACRVGCKVTCLGCPSSSLCITTAVQWCPRWTRTCHQGASRKKGSQQSKWQLQPRGDGIQGERSVAYLETCPRQPWSVHDPEQSKPLGAVPQVSEGNSSGVLEWAVPYPQGFILRAIENHLSFFLTALLRYNLHTIKFTHLMQFSGF
jgi:hypothetical protein